ncbi:hypothetical protein OSB04_029110 [Centaurea solstitialis]|uniref:Phosphatidylinositol transfer protein N-terminal domain-containing protein n=1 Tax=Centaurea solstitialis TaxID=347529 RepID=A0AA38SIM1_9ASTR|nr:hypothetical protein OSB04_029110 [Centaurea solstitialis]
MPLSLEEYQVAQMYMVMKMQKQNTNSTEGVDVLENRNFEDGLFGKGRYTSKVYRSKGSGELKTPSKKKDAHSSFDPFSPSYLRARAHFHHRPFDHRRPTNRSTTAVAPAVRPPPSDHPPGSEDFRKKTSKRRNLDSFARLWRFEHISLTRAPIYAIQDGLINDCYGKNMIANYKCPYFTSFTLTVETIHKADNGHSENVHGLNKQQLANREIEIIDIASTSDDYWSYVIGSNDVDFSKFQSLRTTRGPLLEGWQDECKPVMTAYKLVTVDAPYWGFGSRLEQAMIAWYQQPEGATNLVVWANWHMVLLGERALFLESHRNCFAWIDEWHGMTVKMMRDIEKQSIPLSHETRGG